MEWDKDVRVKEEGDTGPDGPRDGCGLTIPINRTRGPQVPQSTTGGCSGKAVKNPSRFPAGFEGIKTDCDEDVRSASPTPDWEDKKVMEKEALQAKKLKIANMTKELAMLTAPMQDANSQPSSAPVPTRELFQM